MRPIGANSLSPVSIVAVLSCGCCKSKCSRCPIVYRDARMLELLPAMKREHSRSSLISCSGIINAWLLYAVIRLVSCSGIWDSRTLVLILSACLWGLYSISVSSCCNYCHPRHHSSHSPTCAALFAQQPSGTDTTKWNLSKPVICRLLRAQSELVSYVFVVHDTTRL